MLRPSLAVTAVLLAATTAAGAQTIRYDVRFPNAAHHETEITLTLTDLPPAPVALHMSRSSPGRYALHEFAKNVYALRAVDGAGRAVAVTRPDPYQWDVPAHDGTITVTYTLFADRSDGTYAQLDETHAHLNMPAAFLWAEGLDTLPISVTFHPPDASGWKVATQLLPAGRPFTFTAPNLQYFMDSPTELSAFTLREWPFTHNGRDQVIRLAVHHAGTEAEVDAYAAWARRVVSQAVAVFGEPPAFDDGTYTFIADYLPWASGDGMEHRNSTILTSSRSLHDAAPGLIGTVAHEFFHAWNVERIRPRSLEPFDFERVNMSGELWLAEGFTSYYDGLILMRAGIRDLDGFAQDVAETLNGLVLSPGRRFHSPVEMSQLAPFVDAATAVDPTNQANTFISYYTWGAAIGLGLDLTLRTRFGTDLDAFMRLLWQRYGKTEHAYTLTDVQRALADVSRDSTFAADFFTRYIRGRELIDYESLLASAGLLLRPVAPERAFLGLVNLDYGAEGATIASATRIGSPLYDAGLDRGDIIASVGGRALRGDADWQAIKAAHHPGDTVAVEFVSHGMRRTARLTLAADPRLELVSFEAAGRALTPAMRTLRSAWLDAR